MAGAEIAEGTNLLTIDEDLVGIVDLVGHLEREASGGTLDVDSQAVPGVAGIFGIAGAGPTGEVATDADGLIG